MEEKRHSVGESKNVKSEGRAAAVGGVLCYHTAVVVLGFGLGSQMSRKIHFPLTKLLSVCL